MNKRIKKRKKSLLKGKFFNDRYLVSLLISGLGVKARCRAYTKRIKASGSRGRKQRAEAEGGTLPLNSN